MTQRESKLSGKIIDAMRAEGVFAFKVHGSSYQMVGLPDIIACVNGYFVGFETKMPGKETNTSRVQKHVHRLIHDAHGRVFVISSVREAVQIVKTIMMHDQSSEHLADD